MKKRISQDSPSMSAGRGGREKSRYRILSSEPQTGLIGSYPCCYIYGIINVGQKFALRSSPIGPSGRIYSIPFKDISALVSRTPFSEYDPTDDNLLAHNAALQEAHETYGCAVLPLRFSTIAKSELDVVKVLSSGYAKFKQKMLTLAGKVEIAVKVYCDAEGLKRELLISLGPEKVEGNSVSKRSVEIANHFLEKLKPLCIEYQLNELIFDDMIMNATFLINETISKRFVAEINEFEKLFGLNLRIKWSGPYVPYSFTDPPRPS
jgi:Gas vesicle synthesis protein GvpL/GvpF